MDVILTKGASSNKAFRKKGNTEDNGDDDDDDDEKIHLTSDDLYPVPRQMKSIRLVHNFESE